MTMMALYAFIAALVIGAGWFGYEEWKKKASEESEKNALAQSKATPLNSRAPQTK